MKNFERLMTEYEFEQILEKVRNFDVFDFVRTDKVNRVELRIYSRRCDNGVWRDNFMCSVNGGRKYGDFLGFGRPFQRDEFLSLSYNEVVKMFACYDYIVAEVRQISIFDMQGVY